jgi:1-acyl-sn-glycerol-3-phosphate acyltransferase
MIVSIFYYGVLIVFLTVYGVFLSVVWLLTVWWDRKKTIISTVSIPQAMVLFWLAPGWRVRVEGREHYDRRKPYVIVCNHRAMFDIPLLYALRPNVRWVSKRELIKMPFVGHALLIHGDILIRRGESRSARHMIVRAQKELKKGVSVAIFPEGTRSKGGDMGRFREGAFLLARTAGVEILPVILRGTADAFDGWKLASPHTFSLQVLPPVPADTPPEKVREMMIAAENEK